MELKNKIQEIIESNYNKFLGTNEAELISSEELFILMKKVCVAFLKWQCGLIKSDKIEELLKLTEEELFDKFLKTWKEI